MLTKLIVTTAAAGALVGGLTAGPALATAGPVPASEHTFKHTAEHASKHAFKHTAEHAHLPGRPAHHVPAHVVAHRPGRLAACRPHKALGHGYWSCVVPAAACPVIAHGHLGYGGKGTTRFRCVRDVRGLWHWKRV
ncbi:hypothetical protein [Actinomadura gamaensis]|uniref:Uncharacterized protein n=1 Tax=Actinomadura gamaensis TaxID=1763541 RepID=A0ABV9TZI9_9ACTN